jgi:uncharacterized damage-inducible protein DinB
MPSRDTLFRLFERMEAERKALIAQLDRISEADLTTAPRPGAWSVAQVITHVAMAEEGSLAYLRKKYGGQRHKRAAFSGRWRLPLLNLAISLPVKYRAPALIATVPATSYDEARSRWEGVRTAMRRTYDALPEELIGHDLFKHPSVGRFSLTQGMRFMRRHALRHRGQIMRTLKAMKVTVPR